MKFKVALVGLLSSGLTASVAARHASTRNLGRPVCGDGIVSGGEQCDGTDFDGKTCGDYGFSEGSLICTSSCSVDTSSCSNGGGGPVCGDGILEGTEECDGTDLGAATCADQGCTGGTPTCSSCTLDYSSCTGCSTGPTDWSAESTAAMSWLTSQNQVKGPKMAIQSYEVDSSNPLDGVCFVYDQAVAAIAYVAGGQTNNAQKVLKNLQNWQQGSGSFYTAHWCGSGGIWEYNQHVGPTIWVAMAAKKYSLATGDSQFEAMGNAAIAWSLQFQQADGGVNGGVDFNGNTVGWASTEHNQDVYAALMDYGGYDTEAAGVYSFLTTVVWDATESRFCTGRGDTWNAMDVNPWGILALGAGFAGSMAYIDANHRSSSVCPGVDGYDFDANVPYPWGSSCTWSGVGPDDVWFEGTAFVAAAHNLLGDTAAADYVLSQIVIKQSGNGGIPYSCNGSCNQLWTMSSFNSVAATGWFVIAANRKNPFGQGW